MLPRPHRTNGVDLPEQTVHDILSDTITANKLASTSLFQCRVTKDGRTSEWSSAKKEIFKY
jgi:hypothetical protein